MLCQLVGRLVGRTVFHSKDSCGFKKRVASSFHLSFGRLVWLTHRAACILIWISQVKGGRRVRCFCLNYYFFLAKFLEKNTQTRTKFNNKKKKLTKFHYYHFFYLGLLLFIIIQPISVESSDRFKYHL